MSVSRFICLILVAVFCALIFVPVTPGSTRASLIAKTEVVAGSFTDSAVTFISQSALVFPSEAVSWVQQKYDLNGTTDTRDEAQRRR